MTTGPSLDAMLDPAYLQGALSAAAQEVRARVRECEAAEGELSYYRRMLHGTLDIIRAEATRRASGGEGSLVERLKSILSDQGGGSRGSHVGIPRIPAAGRHGEVERLVAEAHLAKLPEMTDDQLSRVIERVAAAEADISGKRRRMHAIIDALKAELVRRYRDGSASASDVLPPTPPEQEPE